MPKSLNGCLFIMPFDDKYYLFRRKDNKMLSLIGGRVHLPQKPIDAVIYYIYSEIGLLLSLGDIRMTSQFIQRVPPLGKKSFGFCTVYSPKNPLLFFKYGSSIDELTQNLELLESENTETLVLSLLDILKREDVMVATKRILIYYERSKKLDPEHISVFEGVLSEPVFYENVYY